LFRPLAEYELVVSSCFDTPSTKKLYMGAVPPLVSVVANLTWVPWHILLAEGEMVTVGTSKELTIIFTCGVVAVVGEAQVALLVITTQTESLLFKLLLAYELVALFCFETPFTKKS